MFARVTNRMSAARRILNGNKGMFAVAQRNYATDKEFRFDIDTKKAYEVYIPEGQEDAGFSAINDFTTATKKELMDMYRMMNLIRRVEIASDLQYKNRKIRGFLHLYDGQEAVVTGIEASATKEDHFITAYREHGHQLVRGDTARRVMAELFGKATGCAGGKGGSMHMYLREANFFGGNGIVGAQVPVGAGLALALKYQREVLGEDNNNAVSFVSYGDGASNQGQVFEAFNMSKLWNLPVIFICENNKYGMGTAIHRSSAITDYYKRGQYIHGMRVNGQDIFAVKEAARHAKEWALKNGPVVLEMETYRYHGHSMSDPGITYRTREEINEYRTSRDPIIKMKKRLLDAGVCTEEELKAIEKEVRAEVDDAVKFSDESPLPDEKELVTHVYVDKTYTAKGRTAKEIYHVTQ